MTDTTTDTTPTLSDRLVTSARQLAPLVRTAPVSLLLGVLLWVLHPAAVRGHLGMTLPWAVDDWHLVTSSWTTRGTGSTVLATLAVLALVMPAERVLGSRRLAAAVAASVLVAVPVGLVVARGIDSTELNYWGGDFDGEVFLSPAAWIFGATAFATASMPVLWRRRVRFILLAVSLTLVLYTGTPSDVVAATATVGGILAGRLATGRQARWAPATVWRSRGGISIREVRTLVAVIVAGVAAGPVLAALNPAAEGPFAEVINFVWEPSMSLETALALCTGDDTSRACRDAVLMLQQSGTGPVVANLLPLVLQLVIALGLARGRRVAWWAAVAAQLTTVGIMGLQLARLSVEGGDAASNVVLLTVNAVFILLPWLLVLAVLVATRRYFQVHIDATRLARAGVALLLTLLVTAAVWVVGAVLLAGHFQPAATVSGALAELPYRYLPPALAALWPHQLIPASTGAWALYEWVGNVFWLAVAAVGYRLLMSVPDRHVAADRERAEQLLRAGSGDHLSWMTLWAGNRYWFAPEDAGYVAFRVRNGIAVTVGEPVHGPGSEAVAVAAGFEGFATAQGWQVAWYSVRDGFADSLPGAQRVHVAEESVLDTADVGFTGKRFQNIRTARNRAGKEGIRTVWTTWEECGLDMRDRIISLSEEWVADKALPEMGFTLGAVPELAVPGTRLLLAVDEDGRLHGITSWLPVYVDARVVGYTLDVMRRDATGFRPVIEFLLAEALVIAADEGRDWISLSGAPLATSAAAEAPGLLDATLDKVGATMEPLYGFRSLAASKNKFHPAHHGWYLVYRDELTLPAMGLAIAGCYLPQLRPGDAVTALRAWVLSQRS